MRKIIFVPGLGDDTWTFKRTVEWWNRRRKDSVIFQTDWETGETFEKKLARLTKMIDEENKCVVLIGISAGASLALNAMMKREKMVDKAVSVCGRLRNGVENKFSRFQRVSLSNKAFKDSVDYFEKNEPKLTAEQRKKIMTISAKFWDQLIPKSTSTLKGAENITVPTAEHVITITAALTIFSKRAREFVNE